MKIDDVISKFGRTVQLKLLTGSWISNRFNAFIQPLRYKNKLYMTGEFTRIGRNAEDVYLYLGPKDHNFCDSFSKYKIRDDFGNTYIIDRAEEIIFKNEVVYIWAIIRRITEV